MARSIGQERKRKFGVSDGIRTRDVQIHSLALYQLSYAHHTKGATLESLSLSNIGDGKVSI